MNAALLKAGALIEAHSAHFAHDEADVVWLKKVTENGWFVLSCDRHIISRSWELQVLRAAGAGVFIVIGGELRAADKAQILVDHLTKITDLARTTARPFILKLYRDGQIRPVVLKEEKAEARPEDEP